jgi:hypothetical protein
MTNWDAMQVPTDPKSKHAMTPRGIKTRYLAGGHWRADKSKGGALRPKGK